MTPEHGDFDPRKAEAFANRFLSALNDASLCLMPLVILVGDWLGARLASRGRAAPAV